MRSRERAHDGREPEVGRRVGASYAEKVMLGGGRIWAFSGCKIAGLAKGKKLEGAHRPRFPVAERSIIYARGWRRDRVGKDFAVEGERVDFDLGDAAGLPNPTKRVA